MRLEHIEATTRIIAAHSETIRVSFHFTHSVTISTAIQRIDLLRPQKITQDHAETHRHALDALVKVAALRDLPSPKSE